MSITPEEILDFWYSPQIIPQWFASSHELDREIRIKYAATWEMALTGELNKWRNTPSGCLALVIILDQLPLNMFRGQAKSFESERQAVEIAWHAVKNNYDKKIEREKLSFLYMPFMHSEYLAEQDLAVKLYTESGLEESIKFAEHHRNIIRQFGRFPHRNAILGRESTEQELMYLASANSFKG